MLYLYLGYVATQLYAIAEVFSKNTVALKANQKKSLYLFRVSLLR